MMSGGWVRSLAAARRRPDTYQGGGDAHLSSGVTEPLRLAWEYRALENPELATIHVSPHQYHCLCQAGPLAEPIAQQVVWSEQDLLLTALGEMQSRLDHMPQEWARPFWSATAHFAGFSSLLFLADRGALAIRTSEGLWCQTYERGWPMTPPFLADSNHSPAGLMVTAALNPRWCPGLPFTPQAVQGAIPEVARPHVSVRWHAEDDILPACTVDPHCVLQPENIGRWL